MDIACRVLCVCFSQSLTSEARNRQWVSSSIILHCVFESGSLTEMGLREIWLGLLALESQDLPVCASTALETNTTLSRQRSTLHKDKVVVRGHFLWAGRVCPNLNQASKQEVGFVFILFI